MKEPAPVPNEALLWPLAADHGTISYGNLEKVRSLVPVQSQRTPIAADPQLPGCPQGSNENSQTSNWLGKVRRGKSGGEEIYRFSNRFELPSSGRITTSSPLEVSTSWCKLNSNSRLKYRFLPSHLYFPFCFLYMKIYNYIYIILFYIWNVLYILYMKYIKYIFYIWKCWAPKMWNGLPKVTQQDRGKTCLQNPNQCLFVFIHYTILPYLKPSICFCQL